MDANEQQPRAIIARELGLSSADLILDDAAKQFIRAVRVLMSYFRFVLRNFSPRLLLQDQVAARKNTMRSIEASYRLKTREWIDVTTQIREARASASFNPNHATYRDLVCAAWNLR